MAGPPSTRLSRHLLLTFQMSVCLQPASQTQSQQLFSFISARVNTGIARTSLIALFIGRLVK